MTTPAETTATLGRLRRLTDLLDRAWRIPGTRFRVGLDPILGLLPGVGDAIGLALSSWLLFEARRLGAPRHVQLRMLWHAGVDAVLGAIPVLGDVFDAFYQANRRNLALLEHWVARAGHSSAAAPLNRSGGTGPHRSTPRSR